MHIRYADTTPAPKPPIFDEIALVTAEGTWE